MDISAEIAAIQAASEGSELRQPLVGALNKLNSGSLPAVTASDAGKILKVGANGWEVGEKSGYMPVPTGTKQITENGTHDVTNYASAVVNVSGGGGDVLVQKTITQNGVYNPADDNADGYSNVVVNVDKQTPFLNFLFSSNNVKLSSGRYVSGFTNSGSYIVPLDVLLSALTIDWSISWEVCLTAKYSSRTSKSQVLFGSQSGFFRGLTVEFGPSSSNNIMAATSSNGSSWDSFINFTESNIIMSNNTWYKIIAGFDGVDFYCSVSDGETIATKRIENIATPSAYSSDVFELGGIAKSSNHIANKVSIDILKSYIKNNNSVVWGVYDN